jgi:hypothetical protein
VAAHVSWSAYAKTVGYRPHAEQANYHRSKARFKVPVCGRRFGKSTMAARDLGPKLIDRSGGYYWIVGPTYDLAEKEFRILWNDLMVGRKLLEDKRVKRAYNKKQGEMFIEFPWGTRVECRSARHPDTLVGEGLSGAIMSEAAKQHEETWKRFVRPALADMRGWATFPTTPEGQNWLHRLWRLGRNPDHPDYESWSFPAWKNTHVYPNGYDDPEIQDLLNTTSKEWFDQEIGADFTAFVGKIYGEFQEMDHVQTLTFNPNWPNYVAFDWGFTNPLAAVEFQVGPSDQVHVWRVHYKAGLTIPDHAKMMMAREQPPGYHIVMGFGDAADPEAALQMTQELGIPVITDSKAKENWREGVELVKRFLKLREIGTDLDGIPIMDPLMKFDHGCEEIIDEFNNYKAKKAPRTQEGQNVPEMAANIANHALDALRYGLMHIFKLGATASLSDIYGADGMAQTANGLYVPVEANVNAGMFVAQAPDADGWVENDTGIFTMEGAF